MQNQEIYSGIRLGIPSYPWQGKVLVVGAGIAGLSAAQILLKSGLEVTILEATGRYGGRIWSEKNDALGTIERGAEEIHGKDSLWYHLVNAYGFAMEAYAERQEDYYFVDGQLQAESALSSHQEFQKTLSIWEDLETYQPTQNQTLEDYIKEKSVPHALRYIPEAIWSAEYGTSTENINLKSLLEVYQKWQSGEVNYMLKEGSFQEVIEKVFEDTLPKVQFYEVVHQIDYRFDKITVLAGSRQSFEVDKVLVTIPLQMLKKNLIGFTPPLPEGMQHAIQNIPVDVGQKISLKFKQPFWPKDAGSFYGPGLIPEYYTSPGSDQLTAYVMGKNSATLSALPEEKLILHLLGELGGLFHRGITRDELVSYRISDWGKEQFVEGAYSYPGKDTESFREQLNTPVAKKIYFAGEAANLHGHPATVQGAIESAYDAVRKILELA